MRGVMRGVMAPRMAYLEAPSGTPHRKLNDLLRPTLTHPRSPH